MIIMGNAYLPGHNIFQAQKWTQNSNDIGGKIGSKIEYCK